MSVDIMRLAAHLPPQQQRSLKAAYQASAKNATTAFLLCFFLGIFGAHRFYLGQVGQGVVRLILSPLIIPGLIWEIIDLFRIDGEVYESNLRMAEQLVAGAALAAQNAAVQDDAVARLDALVQEQESARESLPAPTAIGPVFSAEVITPISEDAPAPTYAAEVVSPAPIVPQEPDNPSAGAPASTPESVAPVWPVAAEAAPATESSSRAMSSADVAGDSAPDQPLAAADDEPAPWQPGVALDAASPMWNTPAERYVDEAPAMDLSPATLEFAAATPDAQTPVDHAMRASAHAGIDLTDRAFDPAGALPLADIGEGAGARVHVALPQAAGYDTEALAAANWVVPESQTAEPLAFDSAPRFDTSAGVLVQAGDAGEQHESSTLVFLADEADDAPAFPDAGDVTLAGLAGLAATAEAMGGGAEAPESSVPLAEVKAEPVTGGYESQVMEEVHDQPNEGTRRMVKRVRVVRRLVVNGQVVHEASAEQVVDPDADTEGTAETLRQALSTSDAETLAALANASLPEPPASASEQGGVPPARDA
jgi:TM2 domain-containing membrane protein YozV